MTLHDIENIIGSYESFKNYVESDGDGGQTAFMLDLIIKAIELDGASLADYELLDIIADVTRLRERYLTEQKEENK